MNKKFCPRCGREKGAFIGNFCKDCYVREHPPLRIESQMRLDVCKRCGKVRWKGRWHEQSEGLLRQVVESKAVVGSALENPKLLVVLSPKEDGTTDAEVHVNAIVGNSPLNAIYKTVLRPAPVLCDACMKLSSSYHEAVLQLRYGRKPSPKERSAAVDAVLAVMKAESKGVRPAGVSGVKDHKTGIDFLIGSKHAAKMAAEKLARRNSSKITRSFTITGVDRSGKPKKRFTFCVRMR